MRLRYIVTQSRFLQFTFPRFYQNKLVFKNQLLNSISTLYQNKLNFYTNQYNSFLFKKRYYNNNSARN